MRRFGDRPVAATPPAFRRAAACLAVLLCCGAALVAAADPKPSPSSPRAAPSQPPEVKAHKAAADHSAQELFRGKVVFLREALARRKIEARDEFDKQVVLETPHGDLIPIVPDWRGRAFYQDARLRNRDVELVGKRQKGVPYLQVLMVFAFDDKGRRQYMDYYCDTCAFPMYEIQPCECCQGPVRLRFQPRDLPEYIKAGLSKTAGPVGPR